MLTPAEVAVRLALAGAIGLAVGTEREWSGPTSGPGRRFAGLRTFLLLGLIGGLSGLIGQEGQAWLAAILLLGAIVLVLAEYLVGAVRSGAPLSSTTEAASLVVLGLGVLAAYGYLWPAAATGTIVVFALGEKDRLHWLVHRIGTAEMRAALQFLVLALVVLPLLPENPLFGLDELRPRAIWILVLIFSAIDFVGYLARHVVGNNRGWMLTGVLGGMVSSTAVTLHFSRVSRREPEQTNALILGILAACVMVVPRALAVCLIIHPPTALASLPWLLAYLLAAVASLQIMRRRLDLSTQPSLESADAEEHSPLRLGNAIILAGIFAVALVSVEQASAWWGEGGVMVTASLLGAIKVDALAVAMSRMGAEDGLVRMAAHGLVLGVMVNTLAKGIMTSLLGSPTMRRRALLPLLLPLIPMALLLVFGW